MSPCRCRENSRINTEYCNPCKSYYSRPISSYSWPAFDSYLKVSASHTKLGVFHAWEINELNFVLPEKSVLKGPNSYLLKCHLTNYQMKCLEVGIVHVNPIFHMKGTAGNLGWPQKQQPMSAEKETTIFCHFFYILHYFPTTKSAHSTHNIRWCWSCEATLGLRWFEHRRG